MKLLVTGATGFIGSHFVNFAIENGHEVTAVKRYTTSSPRINVPKPPRWIVSPLCELDVETIRSHEAIIHLAASGVQRQDTNISSLIKSNVLEPLKFFETAIKANTNRFIVAGTCFEYGRSGDRHQFLTTDTPLDPTNPYATSKAAAALAFRVFAEQNNCSLILARIFHAYGKGEGKGKFWSTLSEAAVEGRDFSMSRGEQVRDFVPVHEVARQLLDLTIGDLPITKEMRVVHICSGRAQSLCDFATEQWRMLNATGKIRLGDVPYREGEVMRYVPKECKQSP